MAVGRRPRGSEPAENQTQRPVGLSEFAGKLLDQLSISAWLPAAMLAANLTVLVKMRTLPNPSIAVAVSQLTSDALATLVAAIFGVVLATVITQAFSFESIRILEGYWGSSWFASGLVRVRSNRQLNRVRRMRRRHDLLQKSAFDRARKVMLEKKYSRQTINTVEDVVYGRTDGWSSDRAVKAAAIRWDRHVPPHQSRRLDELAERIQAFPDPHRILPTRLGNVLRATEDQLSAYADVSVENFVYQTYETVPFKLRLQHDQFRSRLDMYCTLLFVFAILAASAPWIISNADVLFRVVTGGVYLVLVVVSYEAAVTSARGYCSVLTAMRDVAISSKES